MTAQQSVGDSVSVRRWSWPKKSARVRCLPLKLTRSYLQRIRRF